MASDGEGVPEEPPTAQPTHYCEDCEGELVIIYDERNGRDVPIVCGNCGGTNTRELQEAEA